MIDFDKYQKEVHHFLHVTQMNFKLVSIYEFKSISELIMEKSSSHYFRQARKGNKFESVFGYAMARYKNYIYMVKETSSGVVCIEIELYEEQSK